MGRRQQQKDATAQRLFEVAVALFRARGYHETTVEEIARAAGVAKGTFFTHFPSKEAVLSHLGRMQVARLRVALDGNPQLAQLSFRDQARFVFHTLGQGIAGQRELVMMITVEILRHRDMAQNDAHDIAAFDALLAPLVAAAQRCGELRADVAAAEAAALVRNVYFMSVFEWLRRDDAVFDEVADRQLDLVLEGLYTR
ncbi:MAG TPA: helix-turn-helix domain-containing protein [Roseiflexaceae bacterium]|nr:helix-turn-helix domain-containing protein [Roseiflexaceae bacterium]